MALTLLMARNRHREARALYERLQAYYRATYRRAPPASLQETIRSAPQRVSAPIPRGA